MHLLCLQKAKVPATQNPLQVLTVSEPELPVLSYESVVFCAHVNLGLWGLSDLGINDLVRTKVNFKSQKCACVCAYKQILF